jgi:hypothetical protein
MYMNLNTNYVVFFGIAIGLLLVLSLWDCQRVKPYSTERYFSTYEGMEDDEEEGFEDDEEEGFESSDIFSESPSSLTCSSGGLSNSGGGLCLSKDQQMMLRTRGGNSSTGEAQIGN